MHGGRQRRQVVQPAGAVVDVVEEDGGRTVAQRARHLRRCHRPQGAAGHPRRGLRDVPVGREGRRVDEDLVTAVPGHAYGPHECLEDIDTGRVAHHDLPGRRPDQRGDPVTDPLGRRPPAALLPGPDAQLAPLAAYDVLDPPGHDGRQRAERVAVEVDPRGVSRMIGRSVEDELGPLDG